MLNFDHDFRNLLLRKIRGLTDKDLRAYEGLLALQQELIQTWEVLKFEEGYEELLNEDKQVKQARLEQQIQRAERNAHSIIEPFEEEFNALHDLWIARRRLAFQQGNFFQVPLSGERLKHYVPAWCNYRFVQALTSLVLTKKRLMGSGQRRQPDQRKPDPPGGKNPDPGQLA